MNIVAKYPFNNGQKVVERKYPKLYAEIEKVVGGVDSTKLKVKESKEKTMPGEMLYDPRKLNDEFKKGFSSRDWSPVRVQCDYPTQYYVKDYTPPYLNKGAFREMDFVKDKLGVEVQFGKYSFMGVQCCCENDDLP